MLNVSKKRPSLPGFCLPIRGQGCQRKRQQEEAKNIKIVSANQRPRNKESVSKKWPRLPGSCPPIRGHGCEGLCHQSDATTVRETVRQSEVNAARDGVTNQMLQLSRILSADHRPRLPMKVSTRKGQEHQGCVCRSEVNGANDCPNQMLQLSGRLSADQRPRLPKKGSARRGQDCQDCVRQSEVNWSVLRRVGSPIRCYNCQGYCPPIRGQGCQRLHQQEEAKIARIVSANQSSMLRGAGSPIRCYGRQVYCPPNRGQERSKDCICKKKPRLPGLCPPQRGQ